MLGLAPLAPLAGGYGGETFVTTDGTQRAVVRVYGDRSAWRGPAAVEVDAALLRLMRGIVPVPEVLEVRRPAGDLPALLVTSWVAGARGDLLLPRLVGEDRRRLGVELGRLLDRLAHVPTPRGGRFVDADLRIEPFPETAEGLPGWVERHLLALGSWEAGELRGLDAVAHHAQGLLDTVGRTCLVHSDVNPKNLLVDPETLRVSALVDWEFAHSGSPYTDLGNLLRFERDTAFVAGVLAGYGGPGGREETLALARAADLYSLVDLAARPDDNPVASAAERLLRAVARTGDLHAVPG